jgi:hypothetical protein
MKNIHVLPTDKPSRLYLHSNNELQLRTNIIRTSEDYLGTNQHICITNDEEIKDGDWCYDKVLNIVFQTDNRTNFDYVNQSDNVFKIILTTDQDLIKDGVQAIEDEFLEWFVQNPSCEFVPIITTTVNNESLYKTNIGFESWRKEEQKQHLIDIMRGDEELGIYEEPKQETLEEAAENMWLDPIQNLTSKMSFIQGAKWQADDIIDKLYIHIINNEDDWSRNPQVEFKSFVKQFINK